MRIIPTEVIVNKRYVSKSNSTVTRLENERERISEVRDNHAIAFFSNYMYELRQNRVWPTRCSQKKVETTDPESPRSQLHILAHLLRYTYPAKSEVTRGIFDEIQITDM